jgi:UDP-N-acetylmuramyl pentapeptide synthase
MPHELEDGTVVLDDTYNANPRACSPRCARRAKSRTSGTRGSSSCIGEMRELGAVSAVEHARGSESSSVRARRASSPSAATPMHYVERRARRGVEAIFADDADSGLELVQSARQAG